MFATVFYLNQYALFLKEWWNTSRIFGPPSDKVGLMRGLWRDDNSKDSICIFLFKGDAANFDSKSNQKLPMFDSNSFF